MNTGKSTAQHSIQGAFVFVLLGLFAIMSTLIVLLGAQMYRGTVDASEANNASRVLGAYVRTMVRYADSADGVKIERFGDADAVALYEDIGIGTYVTRIYVHEGELYEQFTEVENEFDASQGTPICPVADLKAEKTDSLLTVEMTTQDDQTCTVQVALRCK